MKPRGAGWLVRMTGPYTPTISRSVRTMYRVFEYSFIYNYLFGDSFILSETGKIIIVFPCIPQE
jgi:hypothetical protein